MEKGFKGQITPIDEEILRVLFRYRVMTLRLLSFVLSRPQKQVSRRLSILRRFKLISSSPFLTPSLGRLPLIYFLTESGVKFLGEEGNGRSGEISPLFHLHWVGISEIHALLEVGSPKVGLGLIFWEQNQKRLKDKVEVFTGGRTEKLTVQPDAFFVLRDEGRQKVFGFCLEYDRGTTTAWGSEKEGRFARKMKAYWYWWQKGKHLEKFRVKALRILTVVRRTKREEDSWERARNLCQAAKETDPQRKGSFLFWFTSLNEITFEEPERFLKAPIWITSKDFDQGTMHALFEDEQGEERHGFHGLA